MKLQLLVSTGILLVALLPCHDCRALSKSPAAAASAPLPPDFLQPPPSLPVLLRMGEEYFLRLGNLNKIPAASFFASSSSSSSSRLPPGALASNFFRAAVQQLQQLPERSLESAAGPGEGEAESLPREVMEREKRSEEPPISLDLTFHLLREVLEMARAEQLAQQAHSNRKLMEIIGK
ncbi:corticoliberin [Chelonoidis abingdonii]|uniref:Corticotropin releasing hormone n=1 Tax=Chelonoidis abingdonii TaxID=106734 RepID=A0A8C0G684_CHEAB|nr:corticoliberin [Chelonoidis abingdonii]